VDEFDQPSGASLLTGLIAVVMTAGGKVVVKNEVIATVDLDRDRIRVTSNKDQTHTVSVEHDSTGEVIN
jgi:hypothetical protein